MAFFDNPITALLSLELFRQMASNEQISLLKLNAFTAFLMQNSIPYDMAYTPGTRRNSSGLQLTVHINPTTTLVFNIDVAVEQSSLQSDSQSDTN